ncbi:MAG: hypothetical protein M1816_000238 [Peltula sp. TS41687]|nr:MAG: hypothetical protein M1816_000238 [Peltula sp. TS41687]
MAFYQSLAIVTLVTISLFSFKANPARAALSHSSTCRCLPGDACWPNADEWAKLNRTVQGRLVATVPLASVCHDPNYDAAQCAALMEGWELPTIHYNSPSSIMAPTFQNQSCDPFAPEETPCTLGNYVSYSINVSGPEDAAAGIRFAQKQNIRLVIKNTGHDYLGKSTGKGALGLWMHNLKSMEFTDYKSPSYSGPAIKMGAGVQAFGAYTAAAAKGLRVVGGLCPTVGLSGGWTQGGGTSALASTYGLGADQTLEFEVVTADGKLLTASPRQNRDLYWALSGGGGGTYGVVISLTSKAHADGPRRRASRRHVLDAVTLWHAALPAVVDAGVQAVELATNTSFAIITTAPGKSAADVTALHAPFTAVLSARNIPYTLNVTSSPTCFQHFTTYYGPLPNGPYIASQSTGSRFIPRPVLSSASANAALTAAIRTITQSGLYQWAGVDVNVSHAVVGNTPGSNAVHPAWRDATICGVVFHPWRWEAGRAQNAAEQDQITNRFDPLLRPLAPDSGAYLNEADFQVQSWKRDLYGENYERLREVKRKYDTDDLFYATTAVGSDAWVVAGDGRLCRAG